MRSRLRTHVTPQALLVRMPPSASHGPSTCMCVAPLVQPVPSTSGPAPEPGAWSITPGASSCP